MNTNTVIGIVVAVIVIGGGAWYLSTHPMSAPAGQEDAAQGNPQAAGNAVPESGTLSYGEILLMGGSQQCDISMVTSQGPSTGTLYIAGGNVRSDITMQASGMAIGAHMIRTGGYIYSWSDMVNQGVKIKESTTASAPGGSAGAGYDASASVSYSCKPWIADSAKFSVPANVTFSDAPTAKP